TTVEEFLFADGTTLTLDEIRNRMLLGGDGDDQLIGFDDRADQIDGGAGSDAMIGKGGDDTYHFGYSSGQDEIIDTDGVDTLEFGIGLAPGNLRFTDVEGDLLIEIVDTNDSVVIIGGVAADVVENFAFEDGTELTMGDIRSQLFNQQSSDRARQRHRLDKNGSGHKLGVPSRRWDGYGCVTRQCRNGRNTYIGFCVHAGCGSRRF
ncbi:MAG: calcium-binding protein, partial [Gammaproteobacteria bacterium]